MSLQFHAFAKSKAWPSHSPYCQKLETFLRATGVEYKVKAAMPSASPKGKLPFITHHAHGDTKLSDSYFIIRYLTENNIAPDLDKLAGLTPLQHVEARTWLLYMENSVAAYTAYFRWTTDDGWPQMKKEVFSPVPALIRPIIAWIVHRKVKKNIRRSQIGCHTEKEIKGFMKEFFELLDIRLTHKTGAFLFGSKPTVADCVTYAVLASMLATKANPYATSLLLESKLARDYVVMCTDLWFPEYIKVKQMCQ